MIDEITLYDGILRSAGGVEYRSLTDLIFCIYNRWRIIFIIDNLSMYDD